ncbi:MAG TPA: rod shape-determining protein, partial [Lachnospiraceae bacterium]|nr:rod shape-determining protein [Lachnospiraceae bacterium]
GILIVNIGADTTEISILSFGGIVVTKLLPYGGNYFDSQIISYMRKQYNFIIGRRTAEAVKKALVSAQPSDEQIKITGRDIVKGLPGEVWMSSNEIYPLVSDMFHIISVAVQSVVERMPPEIAQEITYNGIYLTGASSWIKGLDIFITDETDIKANTTQDAQISVAKGLGFLAERPKLAAVYASQLK